MAKTLLVDSIIAAKVYFFNILKFVTLRQANFLPKKHGGSDRLLNVRPFSIDLKRKVWNWEMETCWQTGEKLIRVKSSLRHLPLGTSFFLKADDASWSHAGRKLLDFAYDSFK
jgi:hypothetical protein